MVTRNALRQTARNTSLIVVRGQTGDLTPKFTEQKHCENQQTSRSKLACPLKELVVCACPRVATVTQYPSLLLAMNGDASRTSLSASQVGSTRPHSPRTHKIQRTWIIFELVNSEEVTVWLVIELFQNAGILIGCVRFCNKRR